VKHRLRLSEKEVQVKALEAGGSVLIRYVLEFQGMQHLSISLDIFGLWTWELIESCAGQISDLPVLLC
jgi:hypothetical protein